ncbi:MAG: hypothetical protein NC253_13830, partial [Ruminococcus sp.]|nr:hypothetical protein [Ruminococcus sp.]
ACRHFSPLSPFRTKGEFRALRSATGALPLDPASAGLRWTSRLPKGLLVKYCKNLAVKPPIGNVLNINLLN